MEVAVPYPPCLGENMIEQFAKFDFCAVRQSTQFLKDFLPVAYVYKTISS
jgi:hypothetical protein